MVQAESGMTPLPLHERNYNAYCALRRIQMRENDISYLHELVNAGKASADDPQLAAYRQSIGPLVVDALQVQAADPDNTFIRAFAVRFPREKLYQASQNKVIAFLSQMGKPNETQTSLHHMRSIDVQDSLQAVELIGSENVRDLERPTQYLERTLAEIASIRQTIKVLPHERIPQDEKRRKRQQLEAIRDDLIRDRLVLLGFCALEGGNEVRVGLIMPRYNSKDQLYQVAIDVTVDGTVVYEMEGGQEIKKVLGGKKERYVAPIPDDEPDAVVSLVDFWEVRK